MDNHIKKNSLIINMCCNNLYDIPIIVSFVRLRNRTNNVNIDATISGIVDDDYINANGNYLFKGGWYEH
jgi:hypothetical protein